MKKIFAKIIFFVLGWKVFGPQKYPKKCVIIGAPHTSNWDFFVGRCYGYIVGISPSYLIKSSLFVPILGFLIRLNGGIPVYRDSRNNMVDQLVERFIKNDSFMLGLSPEGTRSRVDKWKTGFYHIAHKANVPIVLVGLDFKYKKIGVVNTILPSGDLKKDMLFIQDQFKNYSGKIPNNFNPKII